MLIFLTGIVSAIPLYENDPDLIGYYKLDEADTIMIDYKDNAQPNCNLYYSGSSQQQTSVAPNSNYALGFSGGTDHAINKTCINTLMLSMKNFTINYWIGTTNSWTDERTIMIWYPDAQSGVFARGKGNQNEHIFYGAGGGQVTLNSAGASYSMWTLRFNGTYVALFANTNQKEASAETVGFDINPAPTQLV